MRHRRVLYHWTRTTGIKLNDTQRSAFYGRVEVDELADLPEAVLRDSAAAALARGPRGPVLKLDAWVREARALRNQRTTLTETGKRAAEPTGGSTKRHAPADADAHKRISELLGDAGQERW